MDCIFCKIAQHVLSARIAFEDDHVIAFHDLFPQAPVHLLIIPKQHYRTLNDIPAEERSILVQMHGVAQQLANELNIADTGYRLVFNCNQDGGQSVYHLHMHLLAGRSLLWPPG